MELDRLSPQHLVLDGPLDFDLVVLLQRLHSPGALPHLQGAWLDSEVEVEPLGALVHLEGSLPGGDVDRQVVTRHRGGSLPPGLDLKGGVLRSQLVGACFDRHQGAWMLMAVSFPFAGGGRLPTRYESV